MTTLVVMVVAQGDGSRYIYLLPSPLCATDVPYTAAKMLEDDKHFRRKR